MKIIAHLNAAAIEFDSGGYDESTTWGQLAQRLCDRHLLHPPQLLQLLASLHPENRMECYQLRFGDGYATIVRPTWSEDGWNCGAEIVSSREGDGGRGGTTTMIEANVTLKPRTGPLSKGHRDLASSIVLDKPKGMAVDLHLEKVGPASENNEGVPFPMTQTPFPVDDHKTHILSVREHEQFKGVVDKFSLERARDGGNVDATDVGVSSESAVAASLSVKNDTPTPSAPGSGEQREKKKKRKHKSKEKSSTKSKKQKIASDDGDGEKKKATPPKKSSAKELSAVKKKNDDAGSSNNPSEEKKDGSSSDEQAVTAPEVAKTSSPKKSSSPKNSPNKNKRKEKPAEDKVEKAPSSSKKKAREVAAAEIGDGNEKGEKSAAGDCEKKEDGPKVKRPPNGYIRFSSDIRPKILEENPGLKPTEVTKMIGKAYHALSDVERNRYNDIARAALEKFKAEHPNLPKRKKKQKKEKKGSADDAAASVIAGDGAVVSTSLKIMKENPGSGALEITSKSGEAYKAIGGDKKNPCEDSADVPMAKFTEECGKDALKQTKSKNHKNKKKEHTVNNGADGGGKKRSSPIDLSNLPSKPAKGFPDGWVTREVPRSKGGRLDKYWFSPAKSLKFRSMSEVKRFQARLEEVDGDEDKAMTLYSKGKKKDNSAAGDSKSSKNGV